MEKSSNYHHDNLGSTRVMTDSQGKIVWEQDYMPFGEDLHKPGTVDVDYDINAEYKFTGQREVKGIGLYYYGARHYDPEIGRFITEDNYLGEIGNSQSQNLYIYVMNNPLKYIDPTGNMAVFEVGSPTEDLENGANTIITEGEIDEIDDMIKKDRRLSSSDKEHLKDVTKALRENNLDRDEEDSDVLDELLAKGKISHEVWRAANGMIAYRMDSGSAEAVPFYEDPAFVVPFAITFVAAGGVNATVTFVNDATTYVYVKAQVLWWRILDKIGKGTKESYQIDYNKIIDSATCHRKGGESFVGHALQKHAGRNPDIWGKIKGGPSQINDTALKHLIDILKGKGNFEITIDKGNKFLEKMLQDGRGVRLNLDGTFKGFIDQFR